MDRRTFLRLVGLGTAATAAGLVLPDLLLEPRRKRWFVAAALERPAPRTVPARVLAKAMWDAPLLEGELAYFEHVREFPAVGQAYTTPPAAAYSLHRLKGSYTGPLYLVRLADGSVRDVYDGPVAGDRHLLPIVHLYNQVGDSNHMHSVPGHEPRLSLTSPRRPA
jgi:hypothetical protein